MECARTFLPFDLPYDSFLFSFIQLFDPLENIDIDCMQMSKRRSPLLA
jgi:hypothetical protein